MQDEELDKIINDAANQHHPAYDDAAWGKMLVLLDRHLPQKKDRRRPFIFWLLFLLLGGAVTTTVIMQTQKNSNTASNSVAPAENNSTINNIKPVETSNKNTAGITAGDTEKNKPAAIQTQENATGTGITPAVNNSSTPAAPGNSTAAATAFSTPKTVKEKSRTAIKIKSPVATGNNYTENNTAVKNIKGKAKATIKAAPSYEDEVKNITAHVVTTTANDSISNINLQPKDSAVTKANPPLPDTVARQTVTATAPKSNKTTNKSFKNNFAFTVSGGADKSYIHASNPGKTKFTYGAGVAYTFARRFTASTGFFVSKKTYDARPADYKFPNGATYPYLWLINANCQVYEIPVNIYYNFATGKKHSWFAGGGMSSVIMKEEYYNYKYKMPSGQYYNYEHTYSNENKHFFSVVTLSGGYRYSLTNHIQLMAEPYIKMPLSGIGAGTIKLKSGGILFTAAVKPFVKK